jgi:glycine cleavage system T protein (aminomethyltransferase)
MKPFYTSKENEYQHLRRGVGISDWQHLAKVQVKGPEALEVINRMIISDAARIPIGRLSATYILNPDGSVFADIYVWNQGESFFVIAEGPAPGTLIEHVKTHGKPAGQTTVTDVSDEVSILGVDGPFAWELLKELVGVKILGLRYLEVLSRLTIGGIPVDILRAGKTGEFGYFIVAPTPSAAAVWNALLQKGRDFDAAECGQEALDLCKLENRFASMRHEGAQAANALELNCRILVGRDKEEYTGKEAIEKALAEGVEKRVIGLCLDDPGEVHVEEGAIVEYRGKQIGTIVAANFSYMLGHEIAVAFIQNDYAFVGCGYEVKTVAGPRSVHTVSAPFVFNNSLKVRPQEDSFFTVDWSFNLSAVCSTCSV